MSSNVSSNVFSLTDYGTGALPSLAAGDGHTHSGVYISLHPHSPDIYIPSASAFKLNDQRTSAISLNLYYHCSHDHMCLFLLCLDL